MESSEPRLIKGGIAVDDRGDVSFVNDFQFGDVRRFYTVRNHTRGFVRAWHGHKHEGKYLYCAQGDILVCAVRVDDWGKPSKNLPVSRYVLSARSPAVLHIPGGYANGTMSLSEGSLLVVFSDAQLDKSLKDDFRFPARHWDPWHVEER